jgi:tetratricopeptide (TPR) repeat protein
MTAAVTLLLSVIAAGSCWSAFRFARERDEAERQTHIAVDAVGKAEKAIGLLTEVGERRLWDVPHLEPWQRDLLVTARDFYREFRLLREDSDEPALRFEAALAEKRIGDISALLGDTEKAKTAFRRSVERIRTLADESPGATRYSEHLGVVTNNLAEVHRNVGELADAERLYRQAIRLQTELKDNQPENPKNRRELARTYNNLGILLQETGRVEAARKQYDAAIELLKRLVADDASEPDYRSDLARVYNDLGNHLHDAAEDPAAIAAFGKAILLLRELIDQAQTADDYRFTLRDYRYKLGTVLLNRGNLMTSHDADRTEADLIESLDVLKRLSMEYRGVPLYRQRYADCLDSMATLLAQQNKLQASVATWEEACAVFEDLSKRNPKLHGYHAKLAMVLGSLGWAYQQQKELKKSQERLAQAVASCRKALELSPGNVQYQADLSHYEKILIEVGTELSNEQ